MTQMEIKRKQMILAAYIPGVICLLWLFQKIGDNGAGYLMAAAHCCLLFYLTLLAGLPDAAEKLIRVRMSRGQYKSAGKIWKCALLYGMAAGVLTAGLLYLTAGVWMEKVFYVPYGTISLRLLIPSVALLAVTAVLQGCFQGMGSGMPTVVSKWVQVILAGTFAVFFCRKMMNYGEKAAALLQNQDMPSMYGSAGVALGMTVGCIGSVFFLLIVYMGAGRGAFRKNKEGIKAAENFGTAFRIFISAMAPYMLGGFLLEFPMAAGIFLFQKEQANIYLSVRNYGTFGGKYLMWLCLAVLPTVMGSLPLAGRLLSYMKKEENRQARDCFQVGILWNMLSAGFVAALFAATGFAGGLLRAGSISVLMVSLTVFFCCLLWENGRKKNVFLTLALGGICFILVSILCLKITKGSVFSLVWGSLAQMLVMLMVCGFLVLRAFRFRVEWVRSVLFPLLSAAVSGIIMLLLGKVLIPALGNVVGTLICALIGMFTHLIMLLALKCGRERDLALLPGGRVLIKFGKILHLL